VRFLRALLLGIICSFAIPASAQLTIGTFDPGPYSPSSNIAVTFNIDPTSCIPRVNTFNMYLSDASGNFSAAPTLIGQYNSFYSTYVNGIIPAGTPTGNNYKIRIAASSNGLLVETAPFTINAALPPVTASILSNRNIPNSSANNMHAFGFCTPTSGAAAEIILGNSSSDAVTATITDELNNTNTIRNIPNNAQITYTPGTGHYTMFIKVAMPNGTVATRAYFIINSTTVTNLNTSGGNTVCLPGGMLSYPITTSAYAQNFPGNTYRVDWGDGSNNIYTHCELMLNASISHTYQTSSCGLTNVNGSVITYNAFGINLQTINPFCGNVGTPLSTTARVINSTIASFTGPTLACSTTDVTFVNTSIMGDNPNNNGPSCLPDNAKFNWYINNSLALPYADVDRSVNFVHRFTSGYYRIKLESVSPNGCVNTIYERDICVQNPPVPAFNFNPAIACGPITLTPNNTSTVDAICNTANTYTWLITPAVTYANGTNQNSATPQINFATGIYTIRLQINTATCGVVTSAPQQVEIDQAPSANLSPNTILCTIGTYSFSTFTTGPTRTTVGGTAADKFNTYTWAITGGSYTFANGTDFHTKYPDITFNDFATYTITVTHINSCGTITSVPQQITFTPAPTVDAGPDQNICYNQATVALSGVITGSYQARTWIGNGTFSDLQDLNATYTPTPAERAAGRANIILRATTTLPTPCNVIDNEVIIFIKSRIVLNSPTTKTICTGTAVNYPPNSPNSGVTYSWTSTGTANASGYTDGNGTMITDVLTNSDATTNATVTYTVTAVADGCAGDPFIVTITVTPNPILTATPVSNVICTQRNTAINLSSNLSNTRYTWTSVASAGVTGNTNNATPTAITQLNDLLVNNGTNIETVDYTITPISTNGCPGNPVQLTITVNPAPTTPFAGADESICNSTTFTLKGNPIVVGTGQWTVVPANPAITFNNDADPSAIVSGLQPGNSYVFRWTSTASASCDPKTDDVTITVDPISVGGTTAGAQTICAGTNTGQITLSGQVGNVIRWESSSDGITWPTTINITSSTLTYNNLTTTTHYRAVVQSGSCAIAYSSVTIITVNQAVTIASAGTPQILCNVTSATLNGNSPGPNTGLWSVIPANPAVTFNDATLPNATASGLTPGQTYTFRWTISGPPCPPSTSDVTVRIDLPSNGGTTTGSTNVCAGSNGSTITLSGQVGNILRWESSTDGFTTATTINSTQPSITYSNLTTTTQYRAVVQNGVCGSAFSSVATITVNQGVNAAAAGPDQVLCNQTSVLLAGNSPGVNTGTWSVFPNNPAITFDNAALPNATASGLVPGQTYRFIWTISGSPSCPNSSDDVIITNLAAIAGNSISSTATTYCAGQTITITGSTPTGGNGVYGYVWESSPTGAAPWTTLPVTSRDLSVIANSNISYRRTVNSGTCSSFSNILTITTLPAIANNTIASSQIICQNTSSNPIIGSVPTGGDGANYIYGWEQSIDGGSTWSLIAGASSKDYAPGAITQTTSYRRLVTSAACAGAQQSISNIVQITVNDNARAEFTWTRDIDCTPFQLSNVITATSYPQNGTYEWFADGVSIGTGIAFPSTYPINGNSRSVAIVLRVTSNNGCAPQDSAPHTFSTRPNIIASFTPSITDGCGSQTVTFTNNTTVDSGNTYEWLIDNNVVSNSATIPPQTLDPDPRGGNKEYVVVLRVTTACGPTAPAEARITIGGPAQPILSPSGNVGCSPYDVTFTNRTFARTDYTYTIDFDDGNGPQSFTGLTIPRTFLATTAVRTYNVTLIATNTICGNVTSIPSVITVSPNGITADIIINGTRTYCVGDDVPIVNSSTGANRYEYTSSDGSLNRIVQNAVGPDSFTHRFLTPGTKRITLVASNPCPTSNTDFEDVVILARPSGDFIADITSGCTGLSVKFTSTVSDTESYSWNFGDNSIPVTNANPTHVYANAAPGRYTVTLTITNSLGCSQPITKTDYITIVGPPIAEFAISPSNQITIPDFTFRFTNESSNNPVRYEWDFGDGTPFSTIRDPQHTYLDTGRYIVTLRAYNQYGCFGSTTHDVRIVGVPGYTFVPNSFIPGSTSLPLQKFMAVGSGMKSWKMQIFNKWGQVLWETTKLDDGKPVEGWDGTFKGVPQPQGIYFWKIEVELINGSEWKGMSLGKGPPKRTGEIYLIR
jgi:PKD repeat protein